MRWVAAAVSLVGTGETQGGETSDTIGPR
jgi:hypothetical protein